MHKTEAQVNVIVEQTYNDWCIKRHQQHKDVIAKDIVRVVHGKSNMISVYVNNTLVYYDVKNEYTKAHINDIMDAVVAMMSWKSNNSFTLTEEVLGLWEQTICEIRSEIKAQETPSLVYAKKLCDKLEHSMRALAGGHYQLTYTIE